MDSIPDQALALQAYDGWPIPNSIEADPTSGAIALAKQTYSLVIAATTTQLGPPTGRYNCHGLVFASRRANINSPGAPVDIDRLLQRDRYQRVNTPQIGDIIVYRGPDEIEHTGFVCGVHQITPYSLEPVVVVWSMWGGLGEFEHREQVSPYNDCAIEYRRLRL